MLNSKPLKNLLTLFLVFVFIEAKIVLAQTSDSNLQNEIDDQVWYPFIKAFNSNDYLTFNALHTKEVKRVTKWGVLVGDEYYERNKSSFTRNDSLDVQRKIEFWFEMRSTKVNYSYEVGYYKITTLRKNTEIPEYYFGLFHAVIIKDSKDIWKIDQDWDTDSVGNSKLTMEDYKNYGIKKIYK